MALVPSGNRRFMFAQSEPATDAAEQFDTGGIDPNAMPTTDPPSQIPESGGNAHELKQQVDEIEQEQKKEDEPEDGDDIRETAFEFLKSLGYPPRRLQEFKSQFVSETGSADGGAQVTMTLPDEVYGKNKQIPRDKIKELVKNVEQKHDLSFQQYQRQNEELTLEFISAEQSQQDAADEEEEGPADILDKIYKGSSSSDNSKKAYAKSIQEFINEQKENQYELLRAVVGRSK